MSGVIRPVDRALGLLLLVPLLLCGCTEEPGPIPYPESDVITGVEFDWSTHRRAFPTSDNFPITWSDDGKQYVSWGDGWGECGDPQTDTKQSLGFGSVGGTKTSWTSEVADILGPPECAPGTWANSHTESPNQSSADDGKSYGVISIGGTLYKWHMPGSGRANWSWQMLEVSTDKGSSWTSSSQRTLYGPEDAVNPPRDIGIFHFVNMGRDYGAARDGYVYVIFTEIKDGTWEVQKPGEIGLFRVRPSDLEDGSKYEFFAGMSGGSPTWTAPGWSGAANRQPVFEDPNGVMRNSLTYVPGLDRFILLTNHTARNEGNLGIFEAPDPWGPWKTVAYYETDAGTGWDIDGPLASPEAWFYWDLAPKWFSNGGQDFVMVASGKEENDSMNTVEGRFLLSGEADTTASGAPRPRDSAADRGGGSGAG